MCIPPSRGSCKGINLQMYNLYLHFSIRPDVEPSLPYMIFYHVENAFIHTKIINNKLTTLTQLNIRIRNLNAFKLPFCLIPIWIIDICLARNRMDISYIIYF